ncbi:MAG: TRIC cation channel family protein [Gemmatimonadetes bacterium]|nr:TRIC cation channel family protein [Gemmatimonadota bacterium]
MSPVLVFEVIAVVLAALAAMIGAAKKGLDFVGTYALALIVAFGGGTIRDVLLDRRPFFWADRWEYLVVIFVLCIPFVYSRAVHSLSQRVVARGEFIDALGLGFYTVVGCTLALNADQPAIVAILLGVITSTGGGIMGDVLTNEVPGYFRHGRLYASSAFAGAVTFVGLSPYGNVVAVSASVTIAVALRLVSVWRGTMLPRPHWLDTGAHLMPPAQSSEPPAGS